MPKLHRKPVAERRAASAPTPATPSELEALGVIPFPKEKAGRPAREVFKPIKQSKLRFADLVEGDDYHFDDVRPSEMVVFLQKDGGYQRPPLARIDKLRGIARKFTPAAIGVLHVWLNSAGKIELIDGAGRQYVMLNLLDPIYDAPVKVCFHDHIKTLKQAAEWFLILNPDETTKVTEKNKFGSRLIAKDPDALRIVNTIDKCVAPKAKVGSGGKHGISVQAAYALDHMGVLAETVVLKNKVWAADSLGGPEWVGLGAYIVATRDNSTALRDKLKKTSAEEINRNMRKVHDVGHGRMNATWFAHQILEVRNFNSSKPIGANWAIVNDLMSEKPWSDRWGII